MSEGTEQMSNNIDNGPKKNEVLFRKICIPEVPADMTLELMWNIFSGIGEVEDVMLKKTKDKKYGLVKFVNIEDAKKALRWQLFGAKPRIQQPASIDNTLIHKRENNNTIKRWKMVEYPIKENSLLLLNDDCLLHVFSFCNVFELLQLENVCLRFSELIKSHSYKQQRIIDFNKCKIDVGLLFMRIESCTNVEELKFRYLQQCLLDFSPLSKKEVLENLTLKCLESAKSLQKLDLFITDDSQGFWLKKINNLTHFKISSNTKHDTANFSEFCRNNQTLKYLNISCCLDLNENNIRDIVKYLINLEYLSLGKETFNSQTNFARLANLDKLKKIHLIYDNYGNNINTLKDEFIHALAMKDQLESIELVNIDVSDRIRNSICNFQKLKELIIRKSEITNEKVCEMCSSIDELTHLTLSGCPKLTNTVIINLIEVCPKLEVLNVRTDISPELFIYLPDILRNRSPSKKLTIHFISSYRAELFVKNHQSFFFENRQLLEFSAKIRYWYNDEW